MECNRYVLQFDEVDATFAEFAFGNPLLGLADGHRELRLSQSGSLSSATQTRQEDAMTLTVRRFGGWHKSGPLQNSSPTKELRIGSTEESDTRTRSTPKWSEAPRLGIGESCSGAVW